MLDNKVVPDLAKLGGALFPQRVGMRFARLIFAPSAIANIVFGEADPPFMLLRPPFSARGRKAEPSQQISCPRYNVAFMLHSA